MKSVNFENEATFTQILSVQDERDRLVESPQSYKNIGFLSYTGPDPLKITKLPTQPSLLGHHRPESETQFKWRFAGRPLIARLKWYLDPSSPHQTKKTLSKLDPL